MRSKEGVHAQLSPARPREVVKPIGSDIATGQKGTHGTFCGG